MSTSKNHKNLATNTKHGHITRDFSVLKRRAFDSGKQACLDDNSIINNGVLRSRSRLDIKGCLIFSTQISAHEKVF